MARRQSRKHVANTFLGAMGTAACYAAIKRFLNLFIKKQYYFLKLSFKDTLRLKTSAPGLESLLSRQK